MAAKKKVVDAKSTGIQKERSQFGALLAINPNYFGNAPGSKLKAVSKITQNTTYEEIGCVGFQPQFNRLEAVVYVNRPTGYGGDICSNGTREYVRFYLSYDDGSTWEDQGISAFTAYNIPGVGSTKVRRLEYDVSLDVKPKRKFCFQDNLILCRAILSWNVLPPANTPGYKPVWGEVHNTDIQIDPRKFFLVADLLADVALNKELSSVIDTGAEIATKVPKKLSALQLAKTYKKEVEPGRFAFKEIKQALESKGQLNGGDLQSSDQALSISAASTLVPGSLLDLGIKFEDLQGILFPTDGNTSFEELECIGYNPNLDTLVGTIRVKKSAGYSGGPCQGGSTEYVTFWADLNNNGIFETCLGTTSVEVHDYKNVPKRGLEYSVFLPAGLRKYRKPCNKGPVLIPIRATLSWQVPPPCFNPNYIPTWGNREQTIVHVKPGREEQGTGHAPIIQTVGSMDTDDISPITGLADGPAALAGFVADDSPFAGVVILTGHIANTPDLSSGATALKYRVEVSPDNFATFETVGNSFNLGRDQLLNGVWSNLPGVNQAVDGDGFYTYYEDLIGGSGNAQHFPVGNVLGRWDTGSREGDWHIRIRVKDPANPPTEWISTAVKVRLDNSHPNAMIDITSGGGACADFLIGDTITGTYEATDLHFGSFSLSVAPALGGSFTNPAPTPPHGTMPLVRTRVSTGNGGELGNWSLDTTGMPRCGYTIWIHAYDRAIISSGSIGHHSSDVVGLCLRES